jgi:C4-dicarboxylate transporter DctM subunit
VPIESVALKLFTGIEKFEIMAIPFFILAGNFLTHGGRRQADDPLRDLDGRPLHGGLGLGRRAGLRAVRRGLRARRRRRWSRSARSCCRRWSGPGSRSASAPASSRPSGALGILIPPSIVMVMYSVSTNTSVGALFMAGCRSRHRAGDDARHDHLVPRPQQQLSAPAEGELGGRLKAFRDSFWGLALIVIVMGGIYSGLFTPTEAAAMSAVWAFIAAVFIYKDLSLKDVPRVLLRRPT